MTDLIAGLDSLVGAKEVETDVVTAASVARLAATLDIYNPAPAFGDSLPPGWECACFPPVFRPGALAADGLPSQSGLLPAVDLPRRMFGGARLTVIDPVRVGDELTRISELAGLEQKDTRSGPMVRAMLRRTISTPRGQALVEEQDILYLGEAPAGAPPPPRAAPEGGDWRRIVTPDPVLLFRYSAITFNAHRIHYDTPYARDAEGYPGLLVQGTLLALLLLELCRENNPGTPVRGFSYRAVRPVYDAAPFTVAGRPGDSGAELWIADGEGALAMQASAEFADS